MFSSSWHKREGVSRRIGGGLIAALLAALALLLTGCSEFVDQDQWRAEPGSAVTLSSGHPVGQTFVARHAGLSGVEVWLEPGQSKQGEIHLHLQSDPQAEGDLATTTLPLTQVTAPAFYRFTFSTLPDSHGNYYYACLEMVGEGTALVGGGPGEAYLDGALYRDHLPLDTQMAFRLAYDPRWILLDLGQAAVSGWGLLGLAGLLYVVPGWALLAWLWPGNSLSWAERLGIAAGLSLALYPLLFLWTDLVGLHLGPLYTWLPVAGGSVALVWRYRDWRPRQGLEALRQWACSEALWPDVALVAVAGLVFGVRLLVVRTLDAPLWGDSYHHTMIAQLLVDNGGLFDSWEPYIPYCSLTTHFGFPAAAAVFSWGAGMESSQAVLVAGQLINGLAVLTLYPLAMRIADGNRWAGVGAVLAAGLLSPLPARYVNWGRYAQLAGQAVLPVALWLLWEAARRERLVWQITGLAGIVLSGMTLVYYRMPFYYATFVLAWLVGWGLPNWRTNGRRWLVGLVRLALVGGIALLLVLPWVLHAAGGSLARVVGTRAAMDTLLDHVLTDYQVWRDVALFVPQPLIILALVALLWSLVQQRWTVATVGLWVLGLASLVACSLIRLPGAKMMQNYAIVIALYIPVGLLVGWLIGQIAMLVVQWAGKARRWIMGAVVVSMAVWAAPGQMRIIQPSYVMVTRPDVRAMAWIRENTLLEAHFLVEGFHIWGGYSAVGADAGWWIPLLAGRGNTMPPQYALLNEVPADAGYSQRVVDLVAHLRTSSPTSPESVRLLCDWGITHVYVGQGQGKVGDNAVQLFSPDALTASSVFNEVYRQDRVHVFALDPVVCGVNGR